MEAIDQRGIGYGLSSPANSNHSPLLLGLDTRKKADKNAKRVCAKGVMERYWQANTRIDKSIELTEQDLSNFRRDNIVDEHNLPSAFYVLGNLLTDGDKVDSQDYKFNLIAAGGASAIPLMTRFSHLDKELERKVRECAKIEEQQYPNAIIAEIVFIPESRAGNILARPSFFKYEIPIVGQSTVSKEYQIPLEDLMISVKDGKLLLRSKRLNKLVIPRLSSAHNYHYGMIIYRFLSDLQYQFGSLDISWDWGEFSNLPFTPRVTYKHIILTRAKWKISKISSKINAREKNALISEIKHKYKIPDVIVLIEGDNELVLDLRSPLAADIFIKQLTKSDVILCEHIFDQFQSPLKDLENRQYANELIIPFTIERSIHPMLLEPTPNSDVRRIFTPGTEWAYIKVYGGIMETDRLLQEHATPLIKGLENSGLIKKWFFIRYNDPDHHIRFRFLLKEVNGKLPLQHFTETVNNFFGHLVAAGQIHRIVYDTYERELERYGYESVETCESIFHIDSDSVFRLLPFFKQSNGVHYRWLSGMLGADDLFSAFEFNTSEKLLLATKIRDTFLLEFGGAPSLKYKLDMKYREHRPRIDEFLTLRNSSHSKIHSILADRVTGLQKATCSLRSSTDFKQIGYKLLPSLVHMFINRLFFTRQREQEMVIYHFLVKNYLSLSKKAQKSQSSETTLIDIVN